MEKIRSGNNLEETSTRVENIQNKTELERRDAINELAQLGFLKKINESDFYHGRTNKDGEKWRVDPFYDNASGTSNVNHIPALNVGGRSVAVEFADKRSLFGGSPEVHKIESLDPDASILARNSLETYRGLNQEQRDRYIAAIKKLLPDPEIIHDAEDGIDYIDLLKKNNISPKDISLKEYGAVQDVVKQKAGNDKEVLKAANKLAGRMNARWLIGNGQLLGGVKLNNQKEPIDEAYYNKFLENAKIVGYEQSVISASIHKTIDVGFIADMKNIDTAKNIESEKRLRNARFGRLVCELVKKFEFMNDPQASKFMKTLSDPFSRPKDIVDEAGKVKNGDRQYSELFGYGIGVWEGFTLGEHTQTALQIFDDNYADTLPEKILPIMKMSILTHDFGKPKAAVSGEPQEKYNDAFARKFMHLVGFSQGQSDLARFISEDGSRAVFEYYRAKGSVDEGSKKRALSDKANKFADMAFDRGFRDVYDISGIVKMFEAMWVSDAGAYTKIGKTTRRINEHFLAEIPNSDISTFNKSFDFAHGRYIRPKK